MYSRLSCVVVLALCAPTLVIAKAAVATDDRAAVLDEIEVRARQPAKLERVAAAGSRLQLSGKDIPASITVLSQGDLRQKGEITPL